MILWAKGKSGGVSETSFCGLQRERGGFGLVGGGGILFEGIRRRISLYGKNTHTWILEFKKKSFPRIHFDNYSSMKNGPYFFGNQPHCWKKLFF